jgi:hypothetical protein
LKCSFLERGPYFLANRIHNRHVADYFPFPPLFFIYNFTNVAFDALEEFFKNMALVLFSIQVRITAPLVINSHLLLKFRLKGTGTVKWQGGGASESIDRPLNTLHFCSVVEPEPEPEP